MISHCPAARCVRAGRRPRRVVAPLSSLCAHVLFGHRRRRSVCHWTTGADRPRRPIASRPPMGAMVLATSCRICATFGPSLHFARVGSLSSDTGRRTICRLFCGKGRASAAGVGGDPDVVAALSSDHARNRAMGADAAERIGASDVGADAAVGLEGGHCSAADPTHRDRPCPACRGAGRALAARQYRATRACTHIIFTAALPCGQG
jgi:hypothetical protein